MWFTRCVQLSSASGGQKASDLASLLLDKQNSESGLCIRDRKTKLESLEESEA
jgi:hypothetical protein